MTSRFFRGLGHLPVEGKEQFSLAAGSSSYQGGCDRGRKYLDPINCQPSPSQQVPPTLPEIHRETRKHGRTPVPTVSAYTAPQGLTQPLL